MFVNFIGQVATFSEIILLFHMPLIFLLTMSNNISIYLWISWHLWINLLEIIICLVSGRLRGDHGGLRRGVVSCRMWSMRRGFRLCWKIRIIFRNIWWGEVGMILIFLWRSNPCIQRIKKMKKGIITDRTQHPWDKLSVSKDLHPNQPVYFWKTSLVFLLSHNNLFKPLWLFE